jgi:hypothetical protein
MEAESKLNVSFPVPAYEAIVAIIHRRGKSIPLVRHAAEVPDIHDVVRHTPYDKMTDADCSEYPKSSPVTVIEAPPDCAVLAMDQLRTGPSNVNILCPVPATADTLSSSCRSADSTIPVLHEIDVDEVQDAVVQTAVATCDVAECSLNPKLSPKTIRELPPDHGLFPFVLETTGAARYIWLAARASGHEISSMRTIK